MMNQSRKNKLLNALQILRKQSQQVNEIENRLSQGIEKIINIFEKKQLQNVKEFIKNCKQNNDAKTKKESIVKNILVKIYSKKIMAMSALKQFNENCKIDSENKVQNSKVLLNILVKKLKNRVMQALQKLKLLNVEQDYKLQIDEQIL